MGEFELRSILVATDLSERTDAQVRAAAAIAELTGAALHVLHAFDFAPPDRSMAGGATTFEERIQRSEALLEEQLARAAPRIEVASRRVEIYVPFKAILDRAQEVGADLIVLGPHRQRAIADGVLGSTAEQVIQASGVPCLIVQESLQMPLRRVVAPVELSPMAQRTLGVALGWATALGGRSAEMQVVHVERPDASEASEDQLREIVRDVAAAAGDAGPEITDRILRGAVAADVLVEHARDEKADLLVLATRGRGLIGRLLLGSVAAGVARRAPCPVLLVPPASPQS